MHPISVERLPLERFHVLICPPLNVHPEACNIPLHQVIAAALWMKSRVEGGGWVDACNRDPPPSMDEMEGPQREEDGGENDQWGLTLTETAGNL